MKILNLFLTLSLTTLAATPPKPVTIDPPRFITVNEHSTVNVLVAPFIDVLVILPEKEKIKETWIGNSADWEHRTTTAPSRYLSVKIKHEHPESTTVNIISDHDKPYTLFLIPSADHSDSKVFLEADSSLAPDLQKEPWISPDEAKLRKQADDAKLADAQKVQQKATAELEAYKMAHPERGPARFKWDRKKGADLGIEDIFVDTHGFTRVRINTQNAPALYEVFDKKPSLIDFRLRDGLYTATKTIKHGYLAFGKQRVDFYLE